MAPPLEPKSSKRGTNFGTRIYYKESTIQSRASSRFFTWISLIQIERDAEADDGRIDRVVRCREALRGRDKEVAEIVVLDKEACTLELKADESVQVREVAILRLRLIDKLHDRRLIVRSVVSRMPATIHTQHDP